MCLFATTQEALIAEKDIEVYKVVLVSSGIYLSPHRQCPLPDGVENKDTVLPLDKEWFNRPKCTYQGIHATLDYLSAELMQGMYCYLNSNINHKIIKGTIPKGTHYWVDEKKRYIAAKYIKFDRSEEII